MTVSIMVHEYECGGMAVVHEGKRKLGVYDREGNLEGNQKRGLALRE